MADNLIAHPYAAASDLALAWRAGGCGALPAFDIGLAGAGARLPQRAHEAAT